MQTISVNIPFAGFYNSKWSGLVDNEESNWLEYRASEDEAQAGVVRMQAGAAGQHALKDCHGDPARRARPADTAPAARTGSAGSS